MKYVVALIACLVIAALFSIGMTFLGTKNPTEWGLIPHLMQWAAWIGAWRLTMTLWPDKKMPPLEEKISLPFESINYMAEVDSSTEKIPIQDVAEMSAEKVLAKWPLLERSEEDLFAMAHYEYQSQSRRPGLWAKCVGESLGEEKKAGALYINYRAQQLMDERQQQRQFYKERHYDIPVPFNCPNCNMRLQYTYGDLSEIKEKGRLVQTCPGCCFCFDVRSVVCV